MSFLRENFGVKYFSYNIEKYPFIEMVKGVYKINDLTSLHKNLCEKDKVWLDSGLVPNDKDGSTELHQVFYNFMNESFCPLVSVYELFIKEVVCKIFKTDDIIFQDKPTFRIQYPNNIAVGGSEKDSQGKYGWHKDTNPGYNHPKKEHNFIVPLTFARNTASVFIESSPNSNVFHPADMNVGEFFMFSGGECIHGNKPNDTGKCRVSLDFRVILPNDYDDSYKKLSARSERKFVVGSYYKRIKDNLK